jgi:signal transduction histidine kinase
VIVSQARGGQYALDRAADVLSTVERTGRQALTEMRGLIGVLRTDTSLSPDAARPVPGSEPDPQPPAPQPGLAELDTLVDRTRAAGLAVALARRGRPHPIGPGMELTVYRVAQEALTNTLKHAGPGTEAGVSLDWTADGLVVSVTDSGPARSAAPDPAGPERDHHRPGGNGLAGMRERLAAVGGSLTVGPGPAGGFTVTARLPYREDGQ